MEEMMPDTVSHHIWLGHSLTINTSLLLDNKLHISFLLIVI